MEKENLRVKLIPKKKLKRQLTCLNPLVVNEKLILKLMKLTGNFKGIKKREGLPKSGLTSADKE